jgi:excinuclease UvrABC nuclease subunit
VCVGKTDAKEYAKTIRNIKLFFEGKKGRLVKQLEKEMHEAAKRLEFERADAIKRTIFSLKHIQDVSLLKKDFLENNISLHELEGLQGKSEDVLSTSPAPTRGVGGKATEKGVSSDFPWPIRGPFRVEAYDAAHLGGKNVVGVMTVMEDGRVEKGEYRQFKIRNGSANDLANLEEILMRRLTHTEWRFPSLIVVDGFDLQIKTAEKVLRYFDLDIPVVSVVKDERHKPREILGLKELADRHRDHILLANSEAHRFAIQFHRKRRTKSFLGGDKRVAW